MQDIHTIIFDLGGVYFSDGAKIFSKRVMQEFGLPLQEILEVTSGEPGVRYRTGKITPEDFWKLAVRTWKIPEAKMRHLQELWISGYEPIPGTVALIESLKKNGYRLLFLSDNAPDRVDFLEKKYDFLKHFEGGVFSHILGTKKPDPAMYQAALKLTSDSPSACVYIDDKPNLLEPAKALGIRTIPFTTPEEVSAKLAALGVRM